MDKDPQNTELGVGESVSMAIPYKGLVQTWGEQLSQ
jgi:hypothetical protein